ncbi:MAG TPA: carbon starvation protein A, partial [Gemmataceae bacterium]|nr:carbon starvation protein A [Gemmataceae bacterium]
MSQQTSIPRSVPVVWSVVRVGGHLLPFVLAALCVVFIWKKYSLGEKQSAMPVLLGALCLLAIAYRYYSAFLAAKVAALDDSRLTPAHQFNDGQNYHPTNKWVLFGHHFAAISGAGPLIGPVLAMQWGYCPGLLWLVIGVCLAGAVQDMLVLAASVRRGGKSLAQIALTELGPAAAIVTSLAILFIVIIALAGLGIVVVKALGGESMNLTMGGKLLLPKGEKLEKGDTPGSYKVPAKSHLGYADENPETAAEWGDSFTIMLPRRPELSLTEKMLWLPPGTQVEEKRAGWSLATGGRLLLPKDDVMEPGDQPGKYVLPPGTKLAFSGQSVENASQRWDSFVVQLPPVQSELPLDAEVVSLDPNTKVLVPGSSWGMFTIACTIPIALFVGLYMYRIRRGKVVEASIIGAIGVLAATFIGSYIPHSPLREYFSLTSHQTTFVLAAYGFIASVLPVWMLLCPRDYLSSFLKIGTIVLLILGLFAANPTLKAAPLETEFIRSGPTFQGNIFPFVFICIMCGAISGFHALVSSGTTPKMISKESDVRPIGYGAMLMEGIVGIVALLAAASLDPVKQYYPINTKLEDTATGKYEQQLKRIDERIRSQEPMHELGVHDPHQLPVPKPAAERELAELEQSVGGEVLRGRTGGAVTLAVGMAVVFTDALHGIGIDAEPFVRYWYHFAIMFEALFILTTIDTGTRIARFLLQESLGKIIPKFEKTSWLPGAVLSTFLVTFGWAYLVWNGSISTIWPMFGIANQLLAVLALALVTTLLVNTGKAKYALITILPMLFV